MTNPLTPAQRALVEDNLGLIGYVIRQMRLHIDPDDLFSEGSIALCRAASIYRPGEGASFSTFAVCVIRRRLIKVVTRECRDMRRLVFSDQTDLTAAYTEDGFERAESDETLRHTLARLDVLLDADEAEIARRLLRGESLPEIAREKGQSLSTLRIARSRIAARLHAELNGETPGKSAGNRE